MALGRCGVPTAAPSAAPQHRAPRGGHAGRGKCRLTPSVWFRRVSGRMGRRGFPPDARDHRGPGAGGGVGESREGIGRCGAPTAWSGAGEPTSATSSRCGQRPCPRGVPGLPSTGGSAGKPQGGGGRAPGSWASTAKRWGRDPGVATPCTGLSSHARQPPGTVPGPQQLSGDVTATPGSCAREGAPSAFRWSSRTISTLRARTHTLTDTRSHLLQGALLGGPSGPRHTWRDLEHRPG